MDAASAREKTILSGQTAHSFSALDGGNYFNGITFLGGTLLGDRHS